MKRVQIIGIRFQDAGVIYDSVKMHPHLIGRIGIVEDYNDDAYNAERPTGHERAYYTVKFDEDEVVSIDSAFCRSVI